MFECDFSMMAGRICGAASCSVLYKVDFLAQLSAFYLYRNTQEFIISKQVHVRKKLHGMHQIR